MVPRATATVNGSPRVASTGVVAVALLVLLNPTHTLAKLSEPAAASPSSAPNVIRGTGWPMAGYNSANTGSYLGAVDEDAIRPTGSPVVFGPPNVSPIAGTPLYVRTHQLIIAAVAGTTGPILGISEQADCTPIERAKWTTSVIGTPTGPALSEDQSIAYVGTSTGNVYAINTVDGSMKWAKPLNIGEPITSPLRISGDLLTLATTNDAASEFKVYLISVSGQNVMTSCQSSPIPPGQGPIISMDGSTVFATDQDRSIYRIPKDSSCQSNRPCGACAGVSTSTDITSGAGADLSTDVAGNRLLLPTRVQSRGQNGRIYTVSMDASLKTAPIFSNPSSGFTSSAATIQVGTKTWAFVGDDHGRGHALDITTAHNMTHPATLKWTTAITAADDQVTGVVTDGRSVVFVASNGRRGLISAVDIATGKPRWSHPVSGSINSPPSIDEFGRVFSGNSAGELVAFVFLSCGHKTAQWILYAAIGGGAVALILLVSCCVCCRRRAKGDRGDGVDTDYAQMEPSRTTTYGTDN